MDLHHAPCAYTPEELAEIERAGEIFRRAEEGGHFSDLFVLDDSTAKMYANMHQAAERAQALLDDDSKVRIVFRITTLGPKLIVGIAGRMS